MCMVVHGGPEGILHPNLDILVKKPLTPDYSDPFQKYTLDYSSKVKKNTLEYS